MHGPCKGGWEFGFLFLANAGFLAKVAIDEPMNGSENRWHTRGMGASGPKSPCLTFWEINPPIPKR